MAIAAAHGQGTRELLDQLLERLPEAQAEPSESPEPGADDAIRVAVIGRPNVGKSTLVNRLIGEERVIASEQPGTTRDSILVPFERDGRHFVLVDTAGVRRRARVEDAVERASVGQDAAGDRRGARRDPWCSTRTMPSASRMRACSGWRSSAAACC